MDGSNQIRYFCLLVKFGHVVVIATLLSSLDLNTGPDFRC